LTAGVGFPSAVGDLGRMTPHSNKPTYHEMENSLLNYLYLNLYVNKKPATLFFHIKASHSQSKHYVTIIEEASVQIKSVKINGSNWESFDAAERSVTLPDEKDLRLEVTFEPATN
jgi:hypothetical protein